MNPDDSVFGFKTQVTVKLRSTAMSLATEKEILENNQHKDNLDSTKNLDSIV
jgi:hypothetical protein